MKQTIFIVDDEPDIQKLVSINLKQEHFNTKTFDSGNTFLQHLSKQTPDLIILDLMLPDTNGLEICKILKGKEEYKKIPIIILTAKETETDKVLGLELGADDYITKPFSSKELCARVRAVLRRLASEDKYSPDTNKDLSKYILSFNNIEINTRTYEAKVKDMPISLTQTEFKILSKLLENPNWVQSREDLLSHLWEDTKLVTDRTIDVHIKHLRDKLGDTGKSIKNIRGIGYKIE